MPKMFILLSLCDRVTLLRSCSFLGYSLLSGRILSRLARCCPVFDEIRCLLRMMGSLGKFLVSLSGSATEFWGRDSTDADFCIVCYSLGHRILSK